MSKLLDFPSGLDLGDVDVTVDVDDNMLNSYLFDFGKSLSATAMMNGTHDPDARLRAIMATPAGDPSAVDFSIPDDGVPGHDLRIPRATPEPPEQPTSTRRPVRKTRGRGAPHGVDKEEDPSTNPSVGPSQTTNSVSEDEESSKPAKKGGRRMSKNPKDPKKLAALQEKNRRAQRRFRERQRQRVAELEEKVAELEARLANVKVEKASLANRNGMLEKVVAMGDHKVQRMRSIVKTHSSRSDLGLVPEDTPGDDVILTFQEELPVTLSSDDIKHMSPEQLSTYWREYVTRLGSVLVAAGQDPTGPEAESVNRLTAELTKLVMRIALLSPPLIKQFMLTPAEYTNVSPSIHNAELWPVVLKAMNLTRQQRQDMIQLRRLFLHKLLKVVQARAEINQKLATALPHGTESRDGAMEFLKAHESITQLKANLREEHVLVQDFLHTLLKHVLSLYQVARGIVQYYPLVPDCLALCTWAAAEAGEYDAVQAVTCGSVPNFPLPGSSSTHATPTMSPAVTGGGTRSPVPTQLVSTPGGMMQQPMVNMPMEPQSSATLTAPTMSGTIPPPPPINAPSPMLVVDGVGSYVPFTMYSQQLPQHLQGGMGSGGNMPPYGCAPTPGGVSSPMMPVSGALVGGMVPL